MHVSCVRLTPFDTYFQASPRCVRELKTLEILKKSALGKETVPCRDFYLTNVVVIVCVSLAIMFVMMANTTP